VFGDDPTVERLEKRVAAVLGEEEGLFVASGTMGNQVAISCLTRPGDELLLEAESHIYMYEGGAPAVLSGVQVRPVPGRAGLIDAETFRGCLRPRDVHLPMTSVLVFENTHNRAGGRVLPLDAMEETAAVAREAGIRIHLDGARLWNAAIASGIPERRYADLSDTVSVCFSKGMGAPIGSVVCGTTETIQRGRHVRKRLGGGMRQVGILAAAALHALDHHRDRMVEDHRRAHHLAKGVREITSLEVEPDQVETNIVIIGLKEGTPADWCAALAEAGVLVVPFGKASIRAVTHLDITDEGIERSLAVFAETARRRRGG
jgi:threonine aldolase